MIVFTVLGQPVAKGRPRVTKWGSYTPEKTVNYENLVKFSYLEKYQEKIEGNLSLEVKFYFQTPKSTSKKNKELMELEIIRHNKRPDIDNCIKAITDALNSIAYDDDSQIVEIKASKYYSETPRAIVFIKALDPLVAPTEILNGFKGV